MGTHPTLEDGERHKFECGIADSVVFLGREGCALPWVGLTLLLRAHGLVSDKTRQRGSFYRGETVGQLLRVGKGGFSISRGSSKGTDVFK